MKRNIIQILLLTGIMITVISCKSASTDQEADQSGYGGELITEAQDTIPSVLTVSSDIRRVVVVRLKNRTDLLDGLNEAVEKEGIKNGVILHGIGSVISYHIHAVSETTDFPTVNIFWKKKDPMMC